MAVYNLFELLKQTSNLINEGHSYAEISIFPSEEDFPESLDLEVAIDEDEFLEPVSILSCPDSDLLSEATVTKDTAFLTLTLDEVFLVKAALDRALLYDKECLKEPHLKHSDIDAIKSLSARSRNLLVKVEKILKKLC